MYAGRCEVELRMGTLERVKRQEEASLFTLSIREAKIRGVKKTKAGDAAKGGKKK